MTGAGAFIGQLLVRIFATWKIIHIGFLLSVRLQNLIRYSTKRAGVGKRFETRNSLAHADCFALGSLFALPAAPPTLERGLEMIRRKGMPFTNFYTQTNKSEGHGGNMSIAPKANVRSGRATPYIRDKFISPLVGNP